MVYKSVFVDVCNSFHRKSYCIILGWKKFLIEAISCSFLYGQFYALIFFFFLNAKKYKLLFIRYRFFFYGFWQDIFIFCIFFFPYTYYSSIYVKIQFGSPLGFWFYFSCYRERKFYPESKFYIIFYSSFFFLLTFLVLKDQLNMIFKYNFLRYFIILERY